MSEFIFQCPVCEQVVSFSSPPEEVRCSWHGSTEMKPILEWPPRDPDRFYLRWNATVPPAA